jgi:hypothetical protein
MGAYSFQEQFETRIASDEKRHTIRAKRKDGRRPRVGEVLSLYVGMRTKQCRLLKRRRCVRVMEVWIYESIGPLSVVIDGVELNGDEKDLLSFRDGFANFDAFSAFWLAGRKKKRGKKSGPLDFRGDLIHWESDAAAAADPIPERRKRRPVGERRAGTRRARKERAGALYSGSGEDNPDGQMDGLV